VTFDDCVMNADEKTSACISRKKCSTPNVRACAVKSGSTRVGWERGS